MKTDDTDTDVETILVLAMEKNKLNYFQMYHV